MPLASNHDGISLHPGPIREEEEEPENCLDMNPALVELILPTDGSNPHGSSNRGSVSNLESVEGVVERHFAAQDAGHHVDNPEAGAASSGTANQFWVMEKDLSMRLDQQVAPNDCSMCAVENGAISVSTVPST